MAAFLLLATPTLADGPATDPCRPLDGFAQEAMALDPYLAPADADRMAATWATWASAHCGLRMVSPFWAGLTDAERMDAAWGHQPAWTGAGFVSAPPAPVPLPAGLGLLLMGLGALVVRRVA